MGRGYNTIAFDAAKCDGCGACMTACATAKAPASKGPGLGNAASEASVVNPANSRIQVVPAADGGYELALCRQCGDPKCVAVCPAGALAKDAESGVIGWDASKCVDCLLCTVGCAYAGIALNAEEKHVVKCDTCNGNPACVPACPTGALRYVTTARIYNEVGTWEDMFAPGLAGCQGCNTELLMRHTMRRVGPDAVLATPPGCVPACPTGALRYITTARIYNEVGDWEDMFAPGLAGCQGCNTELLMRHTLRRVGPDTVLATPPGCVPGMGSVGFNGTTGTKVPVWPL